MNKKIIWGIVIVVVVLVIGGIYYFKTQVEQIRSAEVHQAASDLKSYNNEEFGFMFRFPYNFEIVQGVASKNSRLIELRTPSRTNSIDDISLIIRPNQKTLDEFISSSIGDNKFVTTDAGLISGTPAKKLTGIALGIEVSQYFFVYNGNGYRWMSNKNPETELDMRPVLDQILSTFKFTN